MSLQLGEEIETLPASRSQLRRWVGAALLQPARLTLRFVGQEEGRLLNRDYRGRDRATNVLTFNYPVEDLDPFGEAGAGEDPAALAVADLVICLPVVAREAAQQHKTLRDHLAHMVIHGSLHAQGFDHEDEEEAREMEERERNILARFRIADPYATGAEGADPAD